MYSIFTCATLGLFLCFFFPPARKERSEYIWKNTMFTLCGTIAGMLLSAFALGAIPMKEVTDEPVTLVSMRNSDGLSGSFILGTGSIYSSGSYMFMIRTEDGSLAPSSVAASDVVRFVEDPELKNVGYWRTTRRVVDKSHWLYNWTIFASDKNRIIRQEFRIPVGSIVQQFNLK